MVACENYARVYHVIVHITALIRVTLRLPRSRRYVPHGAVGVNALIFGNGIQIFL